MASATQCLVDREVEPIMCVCLPFTLFSCLYLAQEKHRYAPQGRAWTLGQWWQLHMGPHRAGLSRMDAEASATLKSNGFQPEGHNPLRVVSDVLHVRYLQFLRVAKLQV